MVTLLAERGVRPAVLNTAIAARVALAALFLAAVAVRLMGISLFITPDEDNWMRRTGNFAQALESGELRRTFQSGHPGVTTMWIAWVGIGPEASRLAGVTLPDFPVTREPGFMDLLIRARVAFIIVNSALIVAISALVWRLVGVGSGVLSGLLLAFDPFLVAHTQVVHLDGLSAGFITLAMLAAGAYWWQDGSVRYLVLCGVASGLAVLTKAPSLVLGLLLPVVALAAPLVDRARWPWRSAIWSLVVAGAVAAGTIFMTWPALWADPVWTVQRAIEFTIATSGEHRPGNYFMGHSLSDPGPGFYPTAIVFRLAPLTLIGLMALAVFLPPTSARRLTPLLLLLVLGFVLFLSLSTKKLDRYTIPIFPALDILAAIGIWSAGTWTWSRLGRPWHGNARARLVGLVAATGALLLAAALPLASVAPYPLAYYNRLVGGGPTAERVILVGWGEGLDQVAAFLNAQPGIEQQLVSIYFPLELNFQGMIAGTATQFGDERPVHWVVDYVNAAQREHTPAEVRGLAPVHEVWINGIRYARVFRIDPPRRVR